MRTNRNGFTLVELMIAIIIVALLAGMTTVGTRIAMKSAKASATKMQLEQLSMALDKYKAQYGEFPPDFSDPIAVMRHVKLRWPRSSYAVSVDGYNAFCNDIFSVTEAIYSTAGVLNKYHPWQFNWTRHHVTSDAAHVSALVFWLGGLPDSTGVPAGFSLSPTDPIGTSGITQREAPFFKFPDETVLFLTTAFNGIQIDLPAFIPNKKDGKPVLYFLATDNKAAADNPYWGEYALPTLNSNTTVYSQVSTKYYDFTGMDGELGIAVPYVRDTQAVTGQDGVVYNCPVWYEADRFQLIFPGEDGSFGVNANSLLRFPRNLTNVTPEDEDNITNFTEGSTLETEKTDE